MSTQIVECPGFTILIKRLTEFTVQHFSGISNIPHLSVKVRHNNGNAWFGINVLSVTDTSNWSLNTQEIVRDQFMQAMHKIVDMKEMLTDLNRLMESIQDITTNRRRPIWFGGKENLTLQMTTVNNIQIELYRDEVKAESMSYGGYLFKLHSLGLDEKFGAYVYHRGAMLYKYAKQSEVEELLERVLIEQFPQLFKVKDNLIDYVTTIERNRSVKIEH